ncbi:hypothetical protein C7S17_2658 [Burkholderia thailandensis]|nr:hypothetical protein [Burkholderia thailandensis]
MKFERAGETQGRVGYRGAEAHVPNRRNRGVRVMRKGTRNGHYGCAPPACRPDDRSKKRAGVLPVR